MDIEMMDTSADLPSTIEAGAFAGEMPCRAYIYMCVYIDI